MTHDELLARIDAKGDCPFDFLKYNPEGQKGIQDVFNALRAVVELHKPVQGSSDIQTYDYVGCDACVEWSHDGNMNLRYPCPTIQAIEEQIK